MSAFKLDISPAKRQQTINEHGPNVPVVSTFRPRNVNKPFIWWILLLAVCLLQNKNYARVIRQVLPLSAMLVTETYENYITRPHDHSKSKHYFTHYCTLEQQSIRFLSWRISTKSTYSWSHFVYRLMEFAKQPGYISERPHRLNNLPI